MPWRPGGERTDRGQLDVEVVAIGTELLVGHVDTNSAHIAEKLAEAGLDCYYQTRVGDDVQRIAQAILLGLSRADAVICCGGLGPTQDDVTREGISAALGAPLVLDQTAEDAIRRRFAERRRSMPEINLSQAYVPEGATVIPQVLGTAPGFRCLGGGGAVYAVPGVPREMAEMVDRFVIPDLVKRSGTSAAIRTRTLRTWGLSESALAEVLAGRIDVLGRERPDLTVAFLASGMEGIKVRLTAKAASEAEALAVLAEEEQQLRALVGEYIFGADEETMESVLGDILVEKGLSLGLAESLTGGLVASRLVSVPGAGTWFRGGVVSYAADLKYTVLGIEAEGVVTAQAAEEMAMGARDLLGADVALALTGVAGPDGLEGEPPGTVFVGVAGPGGEIASKRLSLPGDRETVRQLATISALDWLRRRLAVPVSAD